MKGGLTKYVLVLAVIPTYFAVREHTPVESEKDYGFGGESDEGRKVGEVEADGKGVIAKAVPAI